MYKFHYFWPEFAFSGRFEPSPNETYPWLSKLLGKLGWQEVWGQRREGEGRTSRVIAVNGPVMRISIQEVIS